MTSEDTQRIVINRRYGGFSLSERAVEWMGDRGVDNPRDLTRDDPQLVECVETLGEEAGGRFATLQVVEIPEDVEWEVMEYDGMEWVAEEHRTWSP